MAKGKKATTATKVSGGLAANRRRRRARANPGTSLAANPPLAQDLVNVLLPGFAAYAATRVIQRVVFQIVQKKWPKLGKHAAALAGAAGFGGVWFLGHKIQRLAKYHDGIVMGSGVAALHGIATCYLPTKYRWLLTDCEPEDALPDPTTAPTLPATVAQAPTSTASDEYSYLEDQIAALSSQRVHTIPAPKPSAKPISSALKMATHGASSENMDPDLTNELDGEEVDDLYSGPFSTDN